MKRSIFTLLAVLFSVMGIVGSVPAIAGGTILDSFSDEIILKEHTDTVIVAVIVGVYKKQANTNEDPPRLIIDITEIVRGKAKLGYAKALWEPVSSGIDAGNIEKLQKAWLKERCSPPDVGTKWILNGRFDEKHDIFLIYDRCRYQFSKEKIKWVRSVLKSQIEKQGP